MPSLISIFSLSSQPVLHYIPQPGRCHAISGEQLHQLINPGDAGGHMGHNGRWPGWLLGDLYSIAFAAEGPYIHLINEDGITVPDGIAFLSLHLLGTNYKLAHHSFLSPL